MAKIEKEIVGFKFQEIPLEEALNVVMVGDGNYADISANLLDTLPKMDERNAGLAPKDKKSFAFGLDHNKEVPEVQRRGLIGAVNKILKKARVSWRVTYSEKKKLFICVPKAIKDGTKGEFVPRSKWNNIDDEPIIKMHQSGMSPTMIAAKLPTIPIAHIKYVCYQVMTGIKRSPESERIALANDPARVKAFIDIAQSTFKTMDFKTPESRKAVSVVGVKILRLSPKLLAPFLGVSPSGVYFSANNISKTGAAEILKLTEAVKGGK